MRRAPHVRGWLFGEEGQLRVANNFRLSEKGRAMARMRTTAFGILLASWCLTNTGCFWGLTVGGPSLGIAGFPIPVSPYFQDEKEDKFWEHKRYDRVPILGPITSGGGRWRRSTQWKGACLACTNAIAITCGSSRS